MHAPLMAVCTATAARLFGQYLKPATSLVMAAAGAIALAALVEWVQPWFGRTASMDDFLWGMGGITAGCAWQGAGLIPSMPSRMVAWILAAISAVGPPLMWWTQVMLVQAEARRVFPVLVLDTQPRMHLLWKIAPSRREVLQNENALVLSRNADHPGSMHLDTLDRDWTGYAGLEISGTLHAESAVEVGVRLDVGVDGGKRIRAGGWMKPGRGVIQIFWPKEAPTPQVHQLVVFLALNPAAAELEIHHLRLIETKER
ncbi:hypothetical protein [Prosthecobacter sp.]|uniref:hypothetical protein n=1 Tax=Prosthecobacter sp. TaxID=1965333 RepID=UPI0037844171